ncbi:DUF4913 domain-containing protein [Nocardia rhamnosiphila]|uniref:DUF4913 domain-containing protein n=1 Tax=Nocardia rhamnosiphila TaxID=426716 RepID=UPI0033EA0F96
MTTTENQPQNGTDETAVEVVEAAYTLTPPEPVEPQRDLTKVLVDAVRKAVTVDIAAQAKEIADGVVEELLTDDVAGGMRQAAIREALVAIDPAHEAARREAPRELFFRDLEQFVTEHLAQVYRREVTALGSENMVRWCPCWWDHGEVVARLDALWMAWEHMRLGETSEMNSWWIQHADPQMAAIFDMEGPFKYCSVEDGHRAKFAPLPTVPAPTGFFPDERRAPVRGPGPARGEVPAGSRLLVGSVPIGRGPVMEFP